MNVTKTLRPIFLAKVTLNHISARMNSSTLELFQVLP